MSSVIYPRNRVTESVSGSVTLQPATEVALVNTSAARSVDIPSAACVDGRELLIIDVTGSASTNNITLTTEGSENIDGDASVAIISDYGSLRLISDGSNWFTASE